MKPELLLLSMIYSVNEVYLTRMLNSQCVAFSKMQGHPDELAEKFAKTICDECATEYQMFLSSMLENLRSVYPESFGTSETVAELLKRISLS